MEALDSLKIWVNSLTAGEKRHIKLLGKAKAGGSGSQQLALWDWLNHAADDESPPVDAPYMGNLPTVIARLKDLILDGLRLLHQHHDVDAELRTAIENVALLIAKKLHLPALRLLKRAKQMGLATSRYLQVLNLLELEYKLIVQADAPTFEVQLSALRAEEKQIMELLQRLRDLQLRHERLLRLVRHIALPRDPHTAPEILALTTDERLEQLSRNGPYIERALAVNLLGIRLCVDRKTTEAVMLYAQMLHDWRDHADWQVDQASLLLTICKYFQSACFYSKLGWENARWYLQLVPDFKALAPDVARDYQRMLYHNRLTPALNTANFDSVRALIPEIDAWLLREESHLTEAQTLPFLHNFAVATFILGDYKPSNRFVQRILQMPNRKIRSDIREFALVLQAILQYEMGNFSLNEYLTRAGKRHFHKQSHKLAFEYAVFKYLDIVMHEESVEALAELQQDLDALASLLPETVPLLGLMEVRLWVESKQSRQPLAIVFKRIVQENLEAMG